MKIAGDILVDSGCVNKNYVQTMIDKVNQYGSYIVITNLLAIQIEMNQDLPLDSI
ncbi:MAG: hypothetical protein ACRC3I_10465 [Cetobacterium sp.]